jgi:hypothetical protein
MQTVESDEKSGGASNSGIRSNLCLTTNVELGGRLVSNTAGAIFTVHNARASALRCHWPPEDPCRLRSRGQNGVRLASFSAPADSKRQ